MKERVLLEHIPAPVREALAVHEHLRRLGFSADDIFVMQAEHSLFVVLQADGAKFTVDCGPHEEIPKEDFAIMWGRAAALWNGQLQGMSKTTRRRIYETSKILKDGGHRELALAIQAKGIELPVVQILCNSNRSNVN